MKVNTATKLFFVGPAVVFLLLLSVFPLIYSFGMSLTDFSVSRGMTKGFVGISNYIDLFIRNNVFLVSIFNTLKLIVFGVAIQTLIGFFIAKLFQFTNGHRIVSAVRTVYLIPIMVTPLVFGLVSVYMFDPVYGIINHLLGKIGINGMTWYGSNRTSLLTILIVDTWQWTPFVTLLILAGLLSIPNELYEASLIDGAGLLQRIRRIEIPLIIKVLGIAVIMRVMDIFRMFDLIYASTKGGPGITTEVVSMFAYRQSFNFYNTGFGSAAAIFALFLTVFLSTYLNKFIRSEKSS